MLDLLMDQISSFRYPIECSLASAASATSSYMDMVPVHFASSVCGASYLSLDPKRVTSDQQSALNDWKGVPQSSKPWAVAATTSHDDLQSRKKAMKAMKQKKNRQASKQSREKRKAWMNGLLARHAELEIKLNAFGTELDELRDEISVLQNVLAKFAHCPSSSL